MTAAELLAKALVLIEAWHGAEHGDEDAGPDLDHPPLRVETDSRYRGSGLLLPDVSLRTLMEISAAGGRRTVDLGTHEGPHFDAESHFESLENPAVLIVTDDNFYMNEQFVYSIMWDLPASTKWLGSPHAPVSPERDAAAFSAMISGVHLPVEVWMDIYTNLPGSDRYLLELLRATSSGEIVGNEAIGGIDTTRVRAELPILPLWFAYAIPVFDIYGAMMLTGTEFPSPSLLAGELDLSAPTTFDIWIDDQGRVHRTFADFSAEMTRLFELSCPDLDTEQIDIEFTVTTDVSHLDEAIDIEPPPADDTLYFEEFSEFATYEDGLAHRPSAVDPASDRCAT